MYVNCTVALARSHWTNGSITNNCRVTAAVGCTFDDQSTTSSRLHAAFSHHHHMACSLCAASAAVLVVDHVAMDRRRLDIAICLNQLIANWYCFRSDIATWRVTPLVLRVAPQRWLKSANRLMSLINGWLDASDYGGLILLLVITGSARGGAKHYTSGESTRDAPCLYD